MRVNMLRNETFLPSGKIRAQKVITAGDAKAAHWVNDTSLIIAGDTNTAGKTHATVVQSKNPKILIEATH